MIYIAFFGFTTSAHMVVTCSYPVMYALYGQTFTLPHYLCEEVVRVVPDIKKRPTLAGRSLFYSIPSTGEW